MEIGKKTKEALSIERKVEEKMKENPPSLKLRWTKKGKK
jgi:hypothetical protein